MDFTKALVELMTWISRKKRDEAFATAPRKQNVTELVTIMKDDEPQSQLCSTRPDDNNGLLRTKSEFKYPGSIENQEDLDD